MPITVLKVSNFANNQFDCYIDNCFARIIRSYEEISAFRDALLDTFVNNDAKVNEIAILLLLLL